MEYRGNSWHETCFLCHRCQQPIGTKSFIPKDTGYFCVPCFEKQFAYQCCACKKVGLHVTALYVPSSPLLFWIIPWQKGFGSRGYCFYIHLCKCIYSCPFYRSSQRVAWRTKRSLGTVNVSFALAAGSSYQAIASPPGRITHTAWNVSTTCLQRSAWAAPSPFLVSFCLYLHALKFKRCSFFPAGCILRWLKRERVGGVQVWQVLNMSPLRSASGIASVSPACCALCLWWDVVSSLSETTYCAPTAGGRSDWSNFIQIAATHFMISWCYICNLAKRRCTED